MEIPLYLAMTAAEFRSCRSLPKKYAWMACHFSPYGTGLSGFPPVLPQDAMVIVNDRIPIQGHDPDLIVSQLRELAEAQNIQGILLDFQHPGCPQAEKIAAAIARNCPCPVGASEMYAAELPCAVFLPPIPANRIPSDYLTPWSGREIWLEASLEGICAHVDEHGTQFAVMDQGDASPFPHADTRLFCHYRTEIRGFHAQFLIRRTMEDLAELLQEAANHGVTRAIGLYQELHS